MLKFYIAQKDDVITTKCSSFKLIALTLIFVFSLLSSTQNFCSAQWFNWQDATSTRLLVSSVANSDPEEKDMWTADFNNDGKQDLIVVRKQPFSSPSQPGKSTLLLMNVNGILTDQTLLHAPQFIDSISFARDVFVGDFDGDNWKDVIIANTFLQQPQYFRNRGNDILGNWLGFMEETSLRLPVLSEDPVRLVEAFGLYIDGKQLRPLLS